MFLIIYWMMNKKYKWIILLIVNLKRNLDLKCFFVFLLYVGVFNFKKGEIRICGVYLRLIIINNEKEKMKFKIVCVYCFYFRVMW